MILASFPQQCTNNAILWQGEKELLISVGFVDIRIIPEENEFVYADEQEWWASRWTHGTRYALENMPPEVLDRFHADVLSRLAPLKQPDGFHERWRQLYTIGTKFTIMLDEPQ